MSGTIIKEGMSTTQINKILKKGGEVLVKCGIYNLFEPLIVYSDTHVTCEHGVNFVRKHNGRMLQTYCKPSTKEYDGVKNITWNGGIFRADTSKGNANVITLFHAHDITLRNTSIIGCVGLHSIEINACKNVVVECCNIQDQTPRDDENFREAIQIDFANYDGLKWAGATESSKCYDGTHCKNVQITYNTIKRCPVGIGTHTVSNDKKYHEDIDIRTNFFDSCALDVRLCGFKNTKVVSQNVKVVTKTEAHKYHGGKVKLDTPKGNKNIELLGCNVEVE